jgi:hypothetical protein
VPWPALGQVTTAAAIRDRIATVIEALSVVQLKTPFRRYLNEGKGDFLAWAEDEPASAFRRFQVRHTGVTGPPLVSNTDYEALQATFSIVVAYPQTARTGRHQALDRDDLMDRDFIQIDNAVGMNGRGNFSPPSPDACWRAGERATRVIGQACDFLQINYTYEYVRSSIA